MRKKSVVEPTQPTTSLMRPVTPLMAELLNDRNLVQQIGSSAEGIDMVLRQIQLDVATPETASECGHEILALRNVREIFFLFAKKAEALRRENKSPDTTTT